MPPPPRSSPKHPKQRRGNRSKAPVCHWTLWLMGASILSWLAWISLWQPGSMKIFNELLDEDLTAAAVVRRHQILGDHPRRHRAIRRIVDLDQPTVLKRGFVPRDNEVIVGDESTTSPTAESVSEDDDDGDVGQSPQTEEPIRNHNQGVFEAAVVETATKVPIVGHEDDDETISVGSGDGDDDDDDDNDDNDDDNVAGEDDNYEQPEASQKRKAFVKAFVAAAGGNKKKNDGHKSKNTSDIKLTRSGNPLPKLGSNPNTILGGKGTDPDNPKFLFVHVGKAGGTTAYNNIRSLCVRKCTEHNLLIQYHHRQNRLKGKSDYKFINDPIRQYETINCIGKLNRQSNPMFHDPPTEMLISKENMVLGYMHMNVLRYWWNANDDGEATNFKPHEPNVQDEITAILSLPGGEANAYDVSKLASPPDAASNAKDSGLTDATAFLIPIRDPIDRVVSAFNYHHPDNHIQTTFDCQLLEESEQRFRDKFFNRTDTGKRPFRYWLVNAFYCQCFPTVNDLADVLTPGATPKTVSSYNDPTKSVACADLAQTIVRGKTGYKPEDPGFAEENAVDLRSLDDANREEKQFFVGHISFNYGYYYRRTLAKFPKKEVVVIRTEHMFEDLQKLEIVLGGTAVVEGEPSGHASQTYGSGKFAVRTKLSGDERTKFLCCAIASEVRIYRELLEKATNLSPEQRTESLDALAEKCGDLSRCDAAAPAAGEKTGQRGSKDSKKKQS